MTHRLIFDIKPESDIYWCTADLGWVTGHSYILYGPLANGCTGVIYEGTPDFPDKDRFWEIVERYRVSIFVHRADGDSHVHEVGAGVSANARPVVVAAARNRRAKPINPEAWMWYREWIGGNRTPVLDTWWQPRPVAL